MQIHFAEKKKKNRKKLAWLNSREMEVIKDKKTSFLKLKPWPSEEQGKNCNSVRLNVKT